MARKVVCRVTGEYGTSDSFIKIGGKYYKSQEIYDNDKKDKGIKKAIFWKFKTEVLGLNKAQLLPTIVYKEINELNSYGNEVILRTLEESMDSIRYAISHKEFKSEVGKIRYVMAILRNNINDVYRKDKREKLNLSKSLDVVVHNTSTVEEMKKETDIAKPLDKPKRDITAWLEDDE